MIVLAIVLLASGCSWYKNDKCWIDDNRYKKVKELYDKTGSLEIVRQTLSDELWRRCEINEALYRLKKEYHLEQ
jgi:hypothetical protein